MVENLNRRGVNTRIRLNFCTAKAWLHECLATQLGDAILDLLKERSVHWQIVKQLGKVEKSSIQRGLSVPCEQRENVSYEEGIRSNFNQPVENSSSRE